MEGYVLDAVAASVEPVVPGLGPLAGMLAALAGDLAGADPAVVTLEAMEELVTVRGRELLRAVLQFGLDARAAAEVGLAGVTGTGGVRRTLAERGHARTVVTTVGPVRVRRIGYRAKAKGVAALFPGDAALNLPPRGYSWHLQRLAVMFARDGAYELAQEFVLAATGVRIGKRQLEEIVAAAAADVAGLRCRRARRAAGTSVGAAAGPAGGGETAGGAAAGVVRRWQGRGDAPGVAAQTGDQGAGHAGEELRHAAGHRGERPQAGR